MQDKGKQKEVINLDDEATNGHHVVYPHGEGTSNQEPKQLDTNPPIDNRRQVTNPSIENRWQDTTIVSVEDVINREEFIGVNNVSLSKKETQQNSNPILGLTSDNSSTNTPGSHVSSSKFVKETPEENVAISVVQEDGQVLSNIVKKDLNFLHKNWSDIIEEEIEDSDPNQKQKSLAEEVIEASPNQNQKGSTEEDFEVAMSKSKKKNLRQNNKKAMQKVEYNTRSRADSRSTSI